MSVDNFLFGDDEPPPPKVAPEPALAGIADWQIKQLRTALDAQGLTSMEDRQRLIEELLGRPVPSLRDLTPLEARSVQETLAARRPGQTRHGNSWDDREEDTWIDRL